MLFYPSFPISFCIFFSQIQLKLAPDFPQTPFQITCILLSSHSSCLPHVIVPPITFLIFAVIPGHIGRSEYVKLGTTDEGEHVASVFLSLVFLTQCIS